MAFRAWALLGLVWLATLAGGCRATENSGRDRTAPDGVSDRRLRGVEPPYQRLIHRLDRAWVESP